VPRYRSIAAELTRRLEAKDYPPGSMLPSEADLAVEFGVTRMTIRQALNSLAARGLVERRHGHGTAVSSPQLQRHANLPVGLADELAAKGLKAGSRVLRFDEVRPPTDARTDLWVGPRGKTYRIRRLRYANGELIGVQETLIPTKFVPGLLEVDLNGQSLAEILRTRHGLGAAEAELRIEAVGADQTVANDLEIRPGAPILRTTRIGFLEDGRPLERTVGWFLGSRYSYYVRQKWNSIDTSTAPSGARRVSEVPR
jgi:GntR family transcriptional regulator